MTVYELMAKLGAAGIKLWVEEGQLKFKAPKGALTPELKQNLIDNKQSVITFLSEARISEGGTQASIPKADRTLPIPLSHAQQRLWFIEQLTPGSSTFHIPAALYLHGILDISALERAFLKLVQRHEALRTIFTGDGEEPAQIVSSVERFEIPVESLLEFDESSRMEEATRRVEAEVRTSFNLTVGPLIRARLYKLDDNKHGLIVTMHHIVTDGWSMGVFVREITALYAAERMGAEAPLAELPIQYPDFAAWQRQWLQGEELDRQLSYWRKVLDRAPSHLALPFDRPRPALQTLNGATRAVNFDAELVVRLRGVAREFDTTLYVVFMAAYKLVLSKWSQQKDLCVGMPVAGRTRAEVEGLIGFFVNTLVIRTQFTGNPSFREIILQVKEKILGAQSHQDVPFEAIVEELNTPRNLSFSPLYQVALSLTSGDGTAQKAVVGGLEIEPMPIELVAARLDLTMMLVDHGNVVDGMLEFNTDLFDPDTIDLFLTHFTKVLESVCDDRDLSLDALQLYSQQELSQQLTNGRQVDAVLPLSPMQRDFCLDSLRNPDSNRNSIGYAVRIPQIDIGRWRDALDSVAQAHPFLRSRMVVADLRGADSLYQLVIQDSSAHLEQHDWSQDKLTADQLADALNALALPAWQIEDRPLCHYSLVKITDADYYFVVSAHHSIFDGISKVNHFTQVVAAYEGRSIDTVSPVELADWLRTRIAYTDRVASLNFWGDELANYDAPAPKLHEPGPVAVQSLRIDEASLSQLRDWCSSNAVSVANYIRTLYTYALQRCYYHSDEFVLVDAASGRNENSESLIGCAFQFVPHVQHGSVAKLDTVHAALQANRAWKKSVGDAQYISMLQRNAFLTSDALEFQFNYRLDEVKQPIELAGKEVVIEPLQPDNAGTVKLLVTPDEAGLTLRLSYRENEFAGFSLLERMSSVHQEIMSGHTHQSKLDWLLKDERSELLTVASGQDRELGPTLLERFSSQVNRLPLQTAVICGDEQMSYRELDSLSNQLANYLLDLGVGFGDRVAICVGRSVNLLAWYLGVVKTGAAYVPLDVNYPADRIAFIASDSEASFLLTERCVKARFEDAKETSLSTTMQVVLVDEIVSVLANVSDHAPAVTIDSSALLYFVYTSGSTGLPKGAGVYHRGESNLLDWYQSLLESDEGDRFLLVSALGFDLTQKNLFAPVCSGSTLVIPHNNDYDPQQLAQDIKRHCITIVNCAPSAFYPLLDFQDDIVGLRHVILGGEPIRLDVMGAWLAQESVKATLTNSYGPTECSDVVASHSLKELPPGCADLPIGKPLSNTNLHIVNKSGQLMPKGAAGELRISGAGVGAGYWNRDELNNQSFEECPYSDGRWYKTGDICRLNESNLIQYLGRADFQVKLRGLRIELGEIDSQLKSFGGVKDALSLVRDDNLYSYVLSDKHIDLTAAKDYLRQKLPDYMVPAAIISVAVWPLTPNGKIDRKALPQPSVGSVAEFVAPRNDSEQKIADIWCQVLKISEVSVTANFFESGGHSLLATQVVSRIRKEFNVELSVRALFEAPTIERLVRYISTASVSGVTASAPPLVRLDPPNRDTLSFAQYRLWFVDQLNQGSSEYNLPSALKIGGPLDLHVLDKVFGEIVSRHEVLRTNFGETEGVPQLIVREPKDWQSELIDLSHMPAELMGREIERLVDEDAARVYSLQDDSLFSTKIIRLNQSTHILLLNMHHIVSDGWSLGVLIQEIQLLYPAFSAGQTSPLPPLPIQYSDFSVWQRNWLQGEVLDELRQYWQEALRGAPDVLRLPADKPRPKHQTFNGAHFPVELGADLTATLNRFCERNDFTPFMVLMGAYQILLSRYAGQKDICVGIPIAGRNRAELEGLIGFFINGLVIRTRLEDNPSVIEYLRQVKEVSLGAYAHQDMPADLLLDAIKMERTADTSPGAQVGFALQNVAQESIRADVAGLHIEPVAREHKTAKYELSLILQDSDSGLSGVFEYNTDLFVESTIARMAKHFTQVLERLVRQPEKMVDHIDVFSQQDLPDLLGVDSSQYEIRTLSPMQRDMYLDALLEPESLKNSLGYHFITEGDFNIDDWIRASEALVQQQPMLRARILRSDLPYTDVAYLKVARNAYLSPIVEDWSTKKTSDQDAAKYAQDLIWQPYDIEGELSQYFIFKLDSGRHLVVFRMNHIILDGAGMAVHLKNSIDCVQSIRGGKPIESAPNIFDQYVADNIRRTDSSEVLGFWRKQSASIEALDFSIPPGGRSDSGRMEQTIRLPDEHWSMLKAFCEEHRITPSLYFKALYGLLINAYCRGEADFYLSEVVGGRVGQHKRVFGNYFQILPVVFPKDLFRGDSSVNQLFSHIRQYRKSLRANANISLMAQRRLLPQGRLNFMFNYYNFIPSMKLFGTDIKLKAYPQVQDGPVQFVVHEQDGWVELNLIYLADLFSDLGFLHRMEFLSDQILRGVKQIDQLELRLPEEQKPIPVEGVSAEMLPFETVVHGFVEQVQKTPHSIAVKHGGDQLSYIELHNMSGALAAKLAASGVVSGSKVGICLDRGMDMLVSVLAVLKCGAAYVPMDSAYPSERLAYILDDSSAPVLITQQCVRERMEQAGTQIQATVLELDSDTSWRDSIAIDSEALPKAADPIYVIYTSGSTGKPKGAEVTHAGEINLQSWYINALGVSESDRFLLVSAFGFDLTQKNLFAPLLVGGRLVIPDMDDYDIGVVAKTISDESITVVNCAPSAFYPLVEDGSLSGYPYQSLRYVVLGGEPIRLPLLADWLKLGQCRLVNSYGPTECTDVVAFHQYQPDQDGDELPIGKAICNTQLYIVDSANHQLPPGVVGELCIAGAGVGLGYVNKPELTGAVFEPNPFGDGRWYRTGDLVRMRLDGSIDYIGRKDFQVKMRGLRIELGEIEIALKAISGISDSLTLVRNEQLVSYIVAQSDVSTDQVRAQLRNSLPDYMIPSTVTILDRWPLTPNGKIDRNALPDPESNGRPPYVAPRTATEEKLVEIWSEVLGVEHIGVHDSFFDLGGHSLLAARAVAKFRQAFEVDIQLRSLFELHTIADIAQYLDTMKWAAQTAEQVSSGHSEEGRDEGFL